MRRKTMKLVVAVMCATAMGPGIAQTKQQAPVKVPAAPWVEPTSFLGIELGKSLGDQTSVIVPCPTTTQYKLHDWSFKGFCYQSIGGGFLEVYNQPSIGVGYSMTLVHANDVVQGVLLTIYQLGKNEFVALLKARYGEPHVTSVASYQNRMGATFTGSVLTWNGSNTRLRFSEYGAKIDESSFEIMLRSAQTIEDERNNAKAQQNKSKL